MASNSNYEPFGKRKKTVHFVDEITIQSSSGSSLYNHWKEVKHYDQRRSITFELFGPRHEIARNAGHPGIMQLPSEFNRYLHVKEMKQKIDKINRFSYTTFEPSDAEYCLRVFPLIEHLTVLLKGELTQELAETILLLFDGWQSQLISFCMYQKLDVNSNLDEFNFDLIGRRFNPGTVPYLKHLTLELRGKRPQDLFGFDIEILDQLESFVFYSSKDATDIMRLIEPFLRSNPQLRTINLDCLMDQGQSNIRNGKYWLDDMHHSVATRMTTFKMLAPFRMPITLRILVDRFPNLTSFQVCLGFEDNFEYLSSYLWTLSSLASLKTLGIVFMDSFVCIPEDVRFPRMNTVECLAIRIVADSHNGLASFPLGHVFPNVQTLHIENKFDKCSICNLEESKDEKPKDQPEMEQQEDLIREQLDQGRASSSSNQEMECIRQLLQPTTQCAKLRKIYWINGAIRQTWRLRQEPLSDIEQRTTLWCEKDKQLEHVVRPGHTLVDDPVSDCSTFV